MVFIIIIIIIIVVMMRLSCCNDSKYEMENMCVAGRGHNG